MSKELEALYELERFVNEDIGIKCHRESGWHLADRPEFHLIKYALERKERLEKAFSLIKNKKVDVWYEIMLSVRYEDYLDQKTDLSEELTEEEYDLLKEVLK